MSHGDFNEESGYRATREILAAGARPTAIFAGNDLMALDAMTAVREAKLTIPDEIALMGFDDIFPARFVIPSLSTINQFQYDLGRVAAEMVLERLNELPHDASGRQRQMPFEGQQRLGRDHGRRDPHRRSGRRFIPAHATPLHRRHGGWISQRLKGPVSIQTKSPMSVEIVDANLSSLAEAAPRFEELQL